MKVRQQFNTDDLQEFFENLDMEDREEVTRLGYNRIVGDNMMFRAKVSEAEVDIEADKGESLVSKAKRKLFGGDTVVVPFGHEKLYKFTVQMAERLGIGQREAVEFVVLLGVLQYVEDEKLSIDGEMYSRWVDRAESRRQLYNRKLDVEDQNIETIDAAEWENKGSLREVDL